MPKILFKNNKRWKNVFGYLYNKEEELYEKIQLVKSNGYYVLEYNNVHEHVYFSNDIKQTTPKIYLGSFDLVITYKYNSLINKDTIYFLEQNGQIETLYLESENLSYRKNEKKVDIYLPFNFDINKKYGVLYFFDSQNLFNMELDYTNNFDNYGGWQVDKILALTPLPKPSDNTTTVEFSFCSIIST